MCESMGDEIKALESWVTIFASPSTLAETVTKHMLLHRKEIMTDLHTVETDWNAQEYFQSGKAAGDLLTIAIGPVEVPQANYALDLLMLPELVAGFVYGMVGDNHLTEMETCYQSGSELYGFLHTALQDVEQFHLFAAIEEFEKFVYHFQLDAAPCTQMQDDLAAIDTWALQFKQPKALLPTLTKHYLLHKRAITNDIAAFKADWASKAYFAAGRAVADTLTVLVGPIE